MLPQHAGRLSVARELTVHVAGWTTATAFSALVRHADNIVVVADAAFVESFDCIGHWAEQRLEAHAVSTDSAIGALQVAYERVR